jgi:hypothetical protein
MAKFTLDWETTAAGTRYAFVDTDEGTTTLIVEDEAYDMTYSNDGYGGGFDAEVAGYTLGGQGDDTCEVWEDEDGEILKAGTSEECWHWVVDRLAGKGEQAAAGMTMLWDMAALDRGDTRLVHVNGNTFEMLGADLRDEGEWRAMAGERCIARGGWQRVRSENVLKDEAGNELARFDGEDAVGLTAWAEKMLAA